MDVKREDPHVGRARKGQGEGAEANPAWLDSRSIFAGRNEVLIKHGDQVYRLRVTKLGKLILYK
jgi:hemin uptake protein HemP